VSSNHEKRTVVRHGRQQPRGHRSPKIVDHTSAPITKDVAAIQRRNTRYHASKIVTVRPTSAHRYKCGRYGSPPNKVAYPGRTMISSCHRPIAATGANTIGNSAAAPPRPASGRWSLLRDGEPAHPTPP
jgi:hypothetical protein